MGLVTEELQPLADYLGGKSGNDTSKMNIEVDIEKGSILDIPVLVKCPWTFELEVLRTYQDGNGADIYLCKICNVLADESLCDNAVPFEEKLNKIRPAQTVGDTYFSWSGHALGNLGELKNTIM